MTMLHELSGPSQTLHKNPSHQPFADALQMLKGASSLVMLTITSWFQMHLKVAEQVENIILAMPRKTKHL